MVKKIAVFPNPQSQYGVLQYFTTCLTEAFERQGIECEILEVERNNPRPFLEKLLKGKPDCTLSFNGLLPDDEGRFFCDMIKIPHVACLTDLPMPFLELTQSQFSIVACPDRFACEFFRGMGFERVTFLPHGVDSHLQGDLSKERSIDVLMLASFIDYEAIRRGWKEKHTPGLCKVLDGATEMTLRESSLSFIEAFVRAINQQYLVSDRVDPKSFNQPEVLTELEDYIRGRYRVEVIKALKDVKVTLYGAGSQTSSWKEHLGGACPNVEIHDAVSHEEALLLMQKSKVVLNCSPSFRQGAHERIFAGMASGAVVATDVNAFMEKDFANNEAILYYDYPHLKDLNTNIQALLADDAKRNQIARAGQSITLERHTWDNRAKSLLEQLEPILQGMRETVA